VRILLDECLPRELADELIGHEVRTVQEQGWSGIENGELLRRAAGSFAAFLTADKHIEKREQIPGDLAVVTIRAPSNRIQSLRPLVQEILRVLIELKLGRFYRVGV
jgi:hypothetical protein